MASKPHPSFWALTPKTLTVMITMPISCTTVKESPMRKIPASTEITVVKLEKISARPALMWLRD